MWNGKKKGKRDGVPGTKNVDEVGFEPTTSCNGTHDELAKQARYHCAIRPSYSERLARHYERLHALSHGWFPRAIRAIPGLGEGEAGIIHKFV